MGKSSHLCTAKIKVIEMKRSLIVLCLFLFLGTYAIAQRNKMLLPEMRTLTVLAGADGNSLPILQLGSAERLHISFDIMDTEYRRFTYRIEHLTWDFHPTTEIFESDYVRAAAEEEVIEDYEESMNTTTSYAHYWLEFPNERMRPLLAGNYRLSISTEDEDGESVPAAEVYFAVIDPQAALSVNFTTNTDVDWNQAHQQLSMELDMRNLTLRDERAEVKTIILQNRRWDNAVVDPTPTYRNGQKLIWNHCRDLIFPAGNEFRAFDMLSTRYPGMHMESIRWEDDTYQAVVEPDEPRRNYLVYNDRNGQYVSRTNDSAEAATESDYCWTRFTYVAPPLPDADVYLNGQWTNNRFTPEYKMEYDESLGAYVADLHLKLGYYSYQYLAVPHTGKRCGLSGPLDGDFWQTENEYTVLVYYRRTGDRYWSLVAETNPSYKP